MILSMYVVIISDPYDLLFLRPRIIFLTDQAVHKTKKNRNFCFYDLFQIAKKILRRRWKSLPDLVNFVYEKAMHDINNHTRGCHYLASTVKFRGSPI